MTEPTSRPVVVRDVLDAMPAESTAAVQGSAIGRILQPRRHGGFDVGATEFVSVVYKLAERDGSLGWLAAVFNAAAHEVAGLPEHVADAVWGAAPDALVATSPRAGGSAVHDGHLTGRWETVVGAEHADWLLLPTDRGRVLVPRSGARIDPATGRSGLGAAGIGAVTVSRLPVDERHIFTSRPDQMAVIAGAGAAAAVVGSADGVWHKHVDQVRARLATSHGGDQVTDEAAAQVARAASDIDAAKLQVTMSVGLADPAAARSAHQQAVARARGAADHLLGSSRHALNASDPVTRMWSDVHAGCRLVLDAQPRR
ncbi:hypothetical protein M1247_13280 [Mycobacterium sp. 21AC1]|uniref:hypothetical protein n=1 Tax=[Mycobacterium] appelbergii TaxID=2939269 RepID=UPI0029390DD7|nr:hypothetical protein [Mycobacterium sp. 21AC1]MDV3125895.1 hypothetical protein [Mycobacterium sp. 21AC1]